MNTEPQLRLSAGCFLALIWNLPLVLLFWYGWPVVLRVLGANCLLWALLMPVAWYSPSCQVWLFGVQAKPAEHKRNLAIAVMGALATGIGALAASFYEGH
jgi:hypothetical protein